MKPFFLLVVIFILFIPAGTHAEPVAVTQAECAIALWSYQSGAFENPDQVCDLAIAPLTRGANVTFFGDSRMFNFSMFNLTGPGGQCILSDPYHLQNGNHFGVDIPFTDETKQRILVGSQDMFIAPQSQVAALSIQNMGIPGIKTMKHRSTDTALNINGDVGDAVDTVFDVIDKIVSEIEGVASQSAGTSGQINGNDNWIDTYDYCYERGALNGVGSAFRTTDRIVFQLGGNDVLGLYYDLETLDANGGLNEWLKNISGLSGIYEMLYSSLLGEVQTLNDFVSGGWQSTKGWANLLGNSANFLTGGLFGIVLDKLIQDSIESYISSMFWDWQMHAIIDETAKGNQILIGKMLDKNIAGPEILLMEVPPAFSTNRDTNLSKWADKEFWRKGNDFFQRGNRLARYFFRLNVMTFQNIAKGVSGASPGSGSVSYGTGHISYVPGYAMFLTNFVNHAASYYMGLVNGPQIGTVGLDLIHFSNSGNKNWARAMLFQMVSIGWLDFDESLLRTSGYTESERHLLLADISMSLSAMSKKGYNFLPSDGSETINFGEKVSYVNQPDLPGYHKTFTKCFGGYCGFLREEEAAFASERTVFLGGEIKSFYMANNENSKNALGIPLTDSMGWSGYGTSMAFFECGSMHYNSLDFLDKFSWSANACPHRSDSKFDIAGDPSFSGCSNPDSCGARWFEHYTRQLVPVSGFPPFQFSFIDWPECSAEKDSFGAGHYSCGRPGGIHLLENGTIWGNPTNDINGRWIFKVRMTDGQNRVYERPVFFMTGL